MVPRGSRAPVIGRRAILVGTDDRAPEDVLGRVFTSLTPSAVEPWDPCQPMPIYEFYCQACHAVFNFFSASSAISTHPSCPRCGRGDLPRRPSSFATLRRRQESEDAGEPSPLDDIDESRMGAAMDTLMREMG